jgi:hypothetical protein
MGNAGAPVQFYLRLRLQPPGRRVLFPKGSGSLMQNGLAEGVSANLGRWITSRELGLDLEGTETVRDRGRWI